MNGMALHLRGGPHDGTVVTCTGAPPAALVYPVAGGTEEHVYARRLRGLPAWEHYVYQGVRAATSEPREANRPLVQCPACGWHSRWPEDPREHEMDCPRRPEAPHA